MATEQAGPGTGKQFDLGFLFVHGIGTQQRGQTLVEFATPLVRWLELRCSAASANATPSDIKQARALQRLGWDRPSRTTEPRFDPTSVTPTVFRVEVREAQSTSAADGIAPANATISLLAADTSGRTTAEQWLMAESWWAASFGAARFGDLARWGLGVLPWIVGSHCAAQVKRRFRMPLPPVGLDTLTSYSSGVWGRASAVGGLVLGVVVSAVLQPLLVVFLLLSAVPIPALRKALLGLQLRIAAILGDCYVLLARPLEAASIVGQVRRDLAWLAARCSEVVIVAHSQGGAVAHLALRTDCPSELRLLFTFGSGLRKLEEARELESRGSSFAFSAVVTSIAGLLLLAMVAIWFGAYLEGAPQRPASIAAALAIIGLTGAVCAFGIRDHLTGIRLPGLMRWIAHVSRQGWRWRDCYASGDPVPNGAVLRRARGVSREVCNRRSMLADHTSYWANLDEFVSTLYEEVADARRNRDENGRDILSRLRLSADARRAIARRRRWRASIGRTIQWTALAGLVGVSMVTWPALSGMFSWAWTRGGEWLPRELGMTPSDTPRFLVDWSAVGWMALIVVPYRVVRGLWLSWERTEMSDALLGPRAQPSNEGVIPVATGLWFLVLLSVGVLTGEYPAYWIWFVSLLGLGALFALEPQHAKPHADPGRADAGVVLSRPARRFGMTSGVEAVLAGAMGLLGAATLPFGVGVVVWQVLTWLADRLAAGRLWGFDPHSLSAGFVGAAFVAVTAVVVVVTTISSHARRPQGQ